MTADAATPASHHARSSDGFLMDAGFEPQQVLTERFGPTGA